MDVCHTTSAVKVPIESWWFQDALAHAGVQGKRLSAAQPQPNAFGVVMAFVPSSALCRAALNGASSSPTEEVRSGSVPEQLEDKGLEASSNLRFLRSLSNIVHQRPHCGDRTARGQTSRCRQIDQTHSPKILPNMIDFPLLLYSGIPATSAVVTSRAFVCGSAELSFSLCECGKPTLLCPPVTAEMFKEEIEEALRVYDKHVVCLEKTPEECRLALVSLVQKAFETYKNRQPGYRHGIALDKHITVIISQSDGDRPLCGIYFNLHSPYQKKMRSQTEARI